MFFLSYDPFTVIVKLPGWILVWHQLKPIDTDLPVVLNQYSTSQHRRNGEDAIYKKKITLSESVKKVTSNR